MAQALAKLGQREWAIIVMVLALVLGAAWYFTITTSLQNQIPGIESEISQLESERERGLAARRALPQLRAAIAQYEAERQEFMRELPPTEQLGRVLTEITQQARESGVRLRQFNRSGGDSGGVTNVRATNIALQFDARYAELFAFLERIEQLRRFATTSGLNLTLGGGPTSQVGALINEQDPPIGTSLTMTVYTYTGDTASAQPTDGQPPAGQPATGGQP
ncbi:MAG: type 4a pilus biogenesis protein PilO [Meiothermus sp.]|nr:type 4a pilus biogenesis protein PilO [Meiothermus sp.]